jgi:uncharacterized membrane protein
VREPGRRWTATGRKARLYRVGEQEKKKREEEKEEDMAKPEAVFIYIGTYPDEAAARDDYGVVRDLHAAGAVGTYDASVVTKDDAGKVHVNKDEMATRHGAWGGAAVGALIGILFPPAIIAAAAAGAAVGGVSGHLWRGMSRADVKELGEIIDDGQAALLIVGESKLQQALDEAGLKAEKHVAKELNTSAIDIDKAVRESRQRSQLTRRPPARTWPARAASRNTNTLEDA